MKNRYIYLFLLAGLYGNYTHAQEKDITQDIKEITLHGLNSTEKEKRKTSQSLEIIHRDELQKNLGGSLVQSLERVAGINALSIGSGQSKPIIRGLGFNRVVVTEEGIKHESQQWGADHGLEIDQFAVEKLKIVKGPASLMIGSDAIGGIISIEKENIPHNDTIQASINLTAKSINNLLGGSAGFMRKKNSFYISTRATFLDYGDYKIPADYVNIYSYQAPLHKKKMRNTAGQELNFHLNFGWETDNLSSIFYISNLSSKSGLFANAHGLEPRRVDTNLYDASDRDIHFPSQQVNHFKIINKTFLKYNDHLLTIESAFQNNYRKEFGFYISHGYMPPAYPTHIGIPENLERMFNKSTYSLNAKNEFSLGKHLLTLGINSEYQDNEVGGWGFLVPSYHQYSFGGFIYEQFKINPKFLLNAGLRYDTGNIKTEDYFDWFQTPTANGRQYIQRATATRKNYGQFSWGLGANYNFNHWNFRFNAGKSFRMPIAKEIASNGVNYHHFSYEKGNPNLKPEEAYQVDLGIEFRKNKLKIDANPFYQYFTNYIYLNPTADFDNLYGAGNQVYEYTESKVLRYGGELKINYDFTHFLSSEILGEYVYSQQLSGAKKGYNLPFSPAPSVLFNLTYKPKINDRFSNNYISLDYKIGASQNRIVPPESKTAGYQVLNLALGTHIKIGKPSLNVNFQIQNLLNNHYFLHTNYYRIIGVPEAGRNFVLSLKFNY